ncbi:MAG: hypothetical protein JJ939_15305 [Alphaproteobacteria bacterium]|nr:hypothetical protein [Rhodobiaceae bacterium]MBO6542106.1 hypothetical protein [Alphaproteobacteria bacterium]MBO6629782.1 hypothetical protein [Alphaproteobacteria bacterium]MDF1625036.1 hypothetical protein [Parvibaculaceae bacterium]|tara:strand:- start:167 stop:532 length:366 start_codon:yes stop_codon:yes gene_type:complete
MPHENREIVFSMSEFMDALLRYSEMRGGIRYRTHQIRKAGVDPDKGGIVELTFEDTEKLRFSEADILSGLIAYCIEHNVPLPARAGKKVRVNDDGVTLHIESKTDWVAPVPLPIRMGAVPA